MGMRSWKPRRTQTVSRLPPRWPTGPYATDSRNPEVTNLLPSTRMPNKLPLMKLSPEEERFLRHWMYDEVHFRTGVGLAKRLQLEHGVRPSDLAVLIAAAIPDVSEQEKAGA